MPTSPSAQSRVHSGRSSTIIVASSVLVASLAPMVAAQSIEDEARDVPDFRRIAAPGVNVAEYGGFSPGEGPEATPEQLLEVEIQRRAGMIDPGFLAVPTDAAHELFIDIEREVGLRFAMAYTTLFQRASGGPGTRNGGSGDLDFMSSWALLGRDTGNVGRMVLTGEYRHKIGQQPANALGPTIGALTNTTGGFNDRGWVVRDFFWLQNLFEGRLRLLAGRYDTSDYVGTNPLQAINSGFSNRALSANASVAFAPGHGLGAGASITPTDDFYVTFGAQNLYSNSRRAEVSSFFDELDLFYVAEFGLTPNIPGVGRGRYAITGWYADDAPKAGRESDQGVSILLQQSFGDRILAFVRYSYADAVIEGIRHQVSGAVGVSGLLGDPQNMTAFGASWADPRDAGRRDETVLEAFHRFQLTRFTQLTLAIQGIFDPADSTSDAVAVFSGRFRIAF